MPAFGPNAQAWADAASARVRALAAELDGNSVSRACLLASLPGDNCGTAMKSVVADPTAYDWEGDAPLQRPSARTIIYEMHVRGFTRHPSSAVAEAKRATGRTASPRRGQENSLSQAQAAVARMMAGPMAARCREYNSM